MGSITECKDAKKDGKIGTFLSIIGHLMVGVIILLLILVFTTPYGSDILYFLYYGGWLIGLIGLILGVFGYMMKRKKIQACSIM